MQAIIATDAAGAPQAQRKNALQTSINLIAAPTQRARRVHRAPRGSTAMAAATPTRGRARPAPCATWRAPSRRTTLARTAVSLSWNICRSPRARRRSTLRCSCATAQGSCRRRRSRRPGLHRHRSRRPDSHRHPRTGPCLHRRCRLRGVPTRTTARPTRTTTDAFLATTPTPSGVTTTTTTTSLLVQCAAPAAEAPRRSSSSAQPPP